jgi:hypothetical protein
MKRGKMHNMVMTVACTAGYWQCAYACLGSSNAFRVWRIHLLSLQFVKQSILMNMVNYLFSWIWWLLPLETWTPSKHLLTDDIYLIKTQVKSWKWLHSFTWREREWCDCLGLNYTDRAFKHYIYTYGAISNIRPLEGQLYLSTTLETPPPLTHQVKGWGNVSPQPLTWWVGGGGV